MALLNMTKNEVIIVDWGSSRCSYGLDGPGIESWWGRGFSHQS